jgi:hypothetical protein
MTTDPTKSDLAERIAWEIDDLYGVLVAPFTIRRILSSSPELARVREALVGALSWMEGSEFRA